MTTDSELPKVAGIHELSRFFRNFDTEEVVVRPATPGASSFRINVLLSEGKALFPPRAPVHEKDLIERADPRGGVMQYVIQRYLFKKDPFGEDGSHWEASLLEKGHAERNFGSPNIVINGGVNQFAVGNQNTLQQSNSGPAFEDVLAALEVIRRDMPRALLSPEHVAELDEAIEDAARLATEGDVEKPNVIKRALYGVQGAITEIGESVVGGSAGAVKVWATAATTALLTQLTGLS
ncbi:hypothetical protein [Curtobacterium flaccumfaciens]|uniref:hypothetical protein n=1 Tax=Curtobacterium flaccumfaciens TaxID=2035 RepID=UPI003CEBC3D2